MEGVILVSQLRYPSLWEVKPVFHHGAVLLVKRLPVTSIRRPHLCWSKEHGGLRKGGWRQGLSTSLGPFDLCWFDCQVVCDHVVMVTPAPTSLQVTEHQGDSSDVGLFNVKARKLPGKLLSGSPALAQLQVQQEAGCFLE